MSALTGLAIERFRWASLKGALKLEKLGMRRSVRPSARQIVVKAGKFKVNATYDELIRFCEEQMEAFS